MNGRIPKWVWFLCAAGTLAGLVAVLIRGDDSDQAAKPKRFVSIYGEPVTYLGDQVLWTTGEPTTYLVTIPVSQAADEDQRTKQADETFASLAGPLPRTWVSSG